MRWLAYAALAVVGLLVGAFALAWFLLDANAIARPLVAQASAALGEPVEVGAVELSILPMPAARLRNVVIGSGQEPLARAEEIRVSVSLPALFLGQVVLRALEVDAPRIHLELDPEGRPVLPSGAVAEAAPPPAEEGGRAAPVLAITRLRVRDGSLVAGPWAVQDMRVDGGLSLAGTARFDGAAELAGLGRVELSELEIEDVLGDEARWSARASFPALVLEAARERLGLEFALEGVARIDASAAGTGGEVADLSVELESDRLRFAQDDLLLEGPVEAAAELGQTWRLDLSETAVRQGDWLDKPAGDPLALSGPLGRELSPKALGDFKIDLGRNQLEGNASLGPRPRVVLAPTSIEIAPLVAWLRAETLPESGRIEVQELAVDLDPLSLRGALELADVRVPLENGTVIASGPVRAEGTRITAAPLSVSVGGEPVTMSAVYDLAAGTVDVKSETDGSQVDPIVQALLGDSPLTGLIGSNVKLEGPPALESLRGSGSFDIRDGVFRGFSLVKSVLGEMSTLPLLVARVRGVDLERYDEEQFKTLAGEFRLADSVVHLDRLQLEYRHASVKLRGTVGLDGALDLSGEAIISEELDGELAGQPERGRRRVIPISGVRGTISQPRVVLDKRAVQSLLTSYASEGVLGEKLEKSVGKEGAEAIQGILDQILRGSPPQEQTPE